MLYWFCSEFYTLSSSAKNFENRLRFDKVTESLKVGRFLRHSVVFSDISFMSIFAEVTENERIIHRHLRGIHPLLDYDASESRSVISI